MFDFLDASSCRAYYAKHIQIILACVPVIEQSVNEETSWKWVPKEGFLAESKNILDADEEYAREHGHKYAKRIRAEIRAINKNPTPSRIQLISQALSNTEANKKFEDVTEFSELELQHAVELRRSQIVESTGRGEKLIEDMRAKVDELLENEEA